MIIADVIMSQTDCRRQILTFKDGPHTKRIFFFILAIDGKTHNIGIQTKGRKELLG